jgi:hypothetical protein
MERPMSTSIAKAASGSAVAGLRARAVAATHALCCLRNELFDELFDRDGLSVVFQHARNVLSGTAIVAAGMYAAHHLNGPPLPFMWTVHFAGYVVALMGALLLLLNLCDGLHRLAKRRHHLMLRVVTIVIYVALSVRLTQVIVFFRAAA